MTRKTTPPKTYRMLSDEEWEPIERAYRQGVTAGVLERRHGISRVTLYARAARGGWTKRQLRDEAAPPVLDGEPEDQGPAPETPREAALAAVERAARALMKGETAGAADLARVAEVLARVSERLEPVGGAVVEVDDGMDGLAALKARLDARVGLPSSSVHPGEGRGPDDGAGKAVRAHRADHAAPEPYDLGPGLTAPRRPSGRRGER